ncbi:hypothetical protein AS4_42830 [Acinetobacter guillouiae]|nr:hypothetical protein AS4_42830 [Acinetobacter guillouiae]
MHCWKRTASRKASRSANNAIFYIKTLKHHIQDVSVLFIMLLGKLNDFLEL